MEILRSNHNIHINMYRREIKEIKLSFSTDKILLATVRFDAVVIYRSNLCGCAIVGPGSPVNSGCTSYNYHYTHNYRHASMTG